jgi:hypothetical protein
MGRVKVTVVSCDGLPAKDVSGTTDAFIKVAVEDGIPGQVTFQTKVHKSLCPTFNETFEIPNTHRNAVVTFALYDRDVASENDIIGVARLPVSRTTQRQPRRFRLPLIDHSAVAAFIVVKLETLDFGENDPFDEAAETAVVNDLFRLYHTYRPSELSTAMEKITKTVQAAGGNIAAGVQLVQTEMKALGALPPSEGRVVLRAWTLQKPKPTEYTLVVKHDFDQSEHPLTAIGQAGPTIHVRVQKEVVIALMKDGTARAEAHIPITNWWPDDSAPAEVIPLVWLKETDAPRPTVTVQLVGATAAAINPAAASERVRAQYVKRFVRMYDAYSPQQAQLALSAAFAPDPAAEMRALVHRYGAEPVDGKVSITVLKYSAAASVKAPKRDLYVKMELAHQKYKSPVAKNARKEATWSAATATFDVERPTTPVTVWLFADVVGSDEELGSLSLSVARLADGAKKTRELPLLRDSVEVGTVTLELSALGYGEATTASAAYVEQEQHYTSRLRRMLRRYEAASLGQLDVLMTAQRDWERYLANLVRTHGAEPGTYSVDVTVLGCRGLPKMGSFDKCDPYVTLSLDGEVRRTSTVMKTLEPTYNETFTLDLTRNDGKARLDLAVMDEDVDDDDYVGTAQMSLRGLQAGVPSERWLPLLRTEGRGAGVNPVAGWIGLRLTSTTSSDGIAADEAEQTRTRELVTKLFAARVEPLLDTVDVLVRDNIGAEQRLLQQLQAQHGLLPGSGKVSITVLKYSAAASVKAPKRDLYVKMELAHQKYKSPVAKNARKEATWSAATATFDVERPTTPVTVWLFADVVGSDEVLGSLSLSVARLADGAKKTRELPLLRDSVEVGTVTLELSALGYGEATTASAAYVEQEQHYTSRLRRMLRRYEAASLGQLDVLMTAQRDWERYLANLVRTHGAEPGTYSVDVTVLGCRGLPKMGSFDKCDPYVVLSLDGEVRRTSTVMKTLEPTYNETFTLDLTRNDGKARLDLAVMDEDVDDDDLVGTAQMSLKGLQAGVPSERWLPLLRTEGRGAGVNPVAGWIGLRLTSTTSADGIAADEAEQTRTRELVTKLFAARVEPLLDTVDVLVRDNIGAEQRLLQQLQAQHGLLPGSGKVWITVLKYSAAASVKAPKRDLYVKMELAHQKYKSPVAKNARKEATWSAATATFDVERPTTPVTVWLFADVVGSDEELGSLSLSVARLADGAKKTRELPLLRDSVEVGTVTLELSALGYGEATTASAAYVEQEQHYTSRLRRMLRRYEAASLGQLDVLMTAQRDWERYLANLVRTHGAEPGTYSVDVTVLGCRGLPKMGSFDKCDPYVTLSLDGEVRRTSTVMKTLEPTYNETFTLDLTRNDGKARLDLAVMDEDVDDDDLVGTAQMSLKGLQAGVPSERWLPLLRTEGRGAGVNPVAGWIGLRLTSTTSADGIAADEAEQTRTRELVTKLFAARVEPLLDTVDVLVRDNIGAEQRLLQQLQAQHGLLPGSGKVSITVLKYSAAASVKAPKRDLYVKMELAQQKYKSPVAKNARKEATWSAATATFDVERPTTPVTVWLFADVVGSDEELGSLSLSVARLADGAKKTRELPLLRDSVEVGTVTLELSALGYGEATTASAAYVEQEQHYTSRLRRMLRRYEAASLGQLDILMTAQRDWERYLANLVRTHGAEPGTYSVDVTVLGCRGLPKMGSFDKCDPYVTLSLDGEVRRTSTVMKTLEPTYNETFTLDLTRNDGKARLDLAVMDEDVDDDDLVGTAQVDLSLLANGQSVEMWLPLALDAKIHKPATPPRVGIRLQTSTVGRRSTVDPARLVSRINAATDAAWATTGARASGIPEVHVFVASCWDTSEEEFAARLTDTYGFQDGAAVKVTVLNLWPTSKAAKYHIKVQIGEKSSAKTAVLQPPACSTVGNSGELALKASSKSESVLLRLKQHGVTSNVELGRCSVPLQFFPANQDSHLTVFFDKNQGSMSFAVNPGPAGSAPAEALPPFPQALQLAADALCAGGGTYSTALSYYTPSAAASVRSSFAIKAAAARPDARLTYVRIHGCEGLPKTDTFGSCDPYVVVHSFRTMTTKNTRAPTYNDPPFPIFTSDGAQTSLVGFTCAVSIKVMDEDVTTDEVVGECRFTPSAMAPYAFPHYSPILSLPILLEGKVQGHVQLSVTSIPIADVLRLFTANGAPPLRPPAAAHYDAACVAYWLNRFERYFTKYCAAELAKLADTALGPLTSGGNAVAEKALDALKEIWGPEPIEFPPPPVPTV